MSAADPPAIRAFVAIQLPVAARDTLADVCHRLAATAPAGSVRWVSPDRLHLTLRFLGPTAVERLPAVTAALDEVAAALPSFQLRLNGLGGFPSRQRPRVIWAGLQGEVDRLQQLHAALTAALQPLGWEAERRPFHAHLTLGRVRDHRQLAGLDWRLPVAPQPVPVTALHLVESQLRPQGPLYITRHSSRLQAA